MWVRLLLFLLDRRRQGSVGGRGEAEMPVGLGRQLAPAQGALQEADAHEERLVDRFDRVLVLIDARGNLTATLVIANPAERGAAISPCRYCHSEHHRSCDGAPQN